ncbi:MAG: glutathione S-transferase family protein [Parasphingopyxis sp.]|uniref:glutathione S-transferase family protein n=1 Tax=Parasphingopyxis sp. TaxID=1920299 RepID=UPI0032ED0B25
MKLIIGNKAYSSWSMRGWLACKQSGLPFEEVTVPMFGEEWEQRREGNEFAASSGKVPMLWDGETVVWDSLAIVDWLADKVGRDRFWPKDEGARGMARSMAAEMHSSFPNLRREMPVNVRKIFPPKELSEETISEIARILEIWAQARARYGGENPFLFGDFTAADIMYAPVCTRFVTWSVKLPPFAQAYVQAILSHSWMQDWIDAAQDEPWIIEKYEKAT